MFAAYEHPRANAGFVFAFDFSQPPFTIETISASALLSNSPH